MQAGWIAWGLAAFAVAGCGHDVAPRVAACSEILAQRLPAARVVDWSSDTEGGASVEYQVKAWWQWEPAASGQLACSFEAGPRGGLRLRAATLDGNALPGAEITVINTELLLAEMRRAGRAAARE